MCFLMLSIPYLIVPSRWDLRSQISSSGHTRLDFSALAQKIPLLKELVMEYTYIYCFIS